MDTTTSNTTRTSTVASVWADIRNAQRRMNEINRPWTAKHTSR
jgi:hypothetical protein